MVLSALDWSFVIGFFIISLGIGIWTAKSGNKDADDYFTASGKMPWWLLVLRLWWCIGNSALI